MNRQIDTENSSNSLLKDKVRAKISRKEYKDVHVNTFALDGKSTVVFLGMCQMLSSMIFLYFYTWIQVI